MTTSKTYGFSNSCDPKDSIDALEIKQESKPYQGKCEHRAHPCDNTNVVDLEIAPIASYGNGFRGWITLCQHHADYFYEEF